MTGSIAPPRPAATPAAAGRGVSWAPWLLVAGSAVQFALRLWLAGSQTAPAMYPDEAGYMIAARWLAGGPAADLSGFSLYQGGYALLLAPAFLLGAETDTVYRLALGINALLGAALFPLGYLALKRLGLRGRTALPLAWALALLPASTLYGERALADAVLPVLVLGWVLALDRFVRKRGLAAAVLASALAVYAHATHMRGTVVLAVHIAAVAGMLLVDIAKSHAGGEEHAIEQRLRRPRLRDLAHLRAPAQRPALAALATAAAGFAAATVLNSQVREAIYPFGPRDHAGILKDHVTSLEGQLWALSGCAGQIWALVCGTWGLAGLGLLAVVTVAVRTSSAREDRIMSAALLAITFGIAYASSAALPDEQRLGNHAYARYLTCVALIYSLIGIGALLGGTRPARQALATMALIGVTGSWVALYIGDDHRFKPFYPGDFPEVGMLGLSYGELRIPVTSASACVLLLVLLGLRAWSRPALFGGILVINLISVALIGFILELWGAIPNTPLPGPRAGGVAIERPRAGIERPDPDFAKPTTELIYSRVAYQVDWIALQRFDRDRGLPGGGFCMAVVFWPDGVLAQNSWPQHPAGWTYRRAGDAGKRLWWVVWYDPACPARR